MANARALWQWRSFQEGSSQRHCKRVRRVQTGRKRSTETNGRCVSSLDERAGEFRVEDVGALVGLLLEELAHGSDVLGDGGLDGRHFRFVHGDEQEGAAVAAEPAHQHLLVEPLQEGLAEVGTGRTLLVELDELFQHHVHGRLFGPVLHLLLLRAEHVARVLVERAGDDARHSVEGGQQRVALGTELEQRRQHQTPAAVLEPGLGVGRHGVEQCRRRQLQQLLAAQRRVLLAVRVAVALHQDGRHLRVRVLGVAAGQQVQHHLTAVLVEDDLLQLRRHLGQDHLSRSRTSLAHAKNPLQKKRPTRCFSKKFFILNLSTRE